VIIIKNILVCDISNIAHHNKRNDILSLDYVDLLYSMIPEKYEIVGIADCSLYHKINNKKRYKVDYLIPKIIYEAPAGIAADYFILTYALERDAKILSNDRFSEYNFISEKWLEEHQIKFMIIKNQLIFQEPLGNLFKSNEEITNSIDIREVLKYKEKMEG